MPSGPTYDPSIVAAARRSNEVDDKPASEFRDHPELDRDSSYTGGGDFYGDANKAAQQSIARKALKDKLPGGTDRLIDGVKRDVKRGVGVKPLGEFSKGGKVKKTGIYKVHKGERVLNPKETKKAEKSSAMKQVLSGK